MHTYTRTERISTGYPELDEVLSGGYPWPSSILLIGPIGTGKTTLAQGFVWSCLKKGKTVLYVTVDTPPSDIVENMISFGWDPRPYIDDGQLVFVDGFSPRVGLETIAKYIINDPFSVDDTLHSLLLAEGETLAGNGGVLVFSHLSTIMFTWTKRDIIKFMERMHADTRKFNAVYLFIYNENVKDRITENFLAQLTDVVVRTGKEWVGDRLQLYIWIEKCLKTIYEKKRLKYVFEKGRIRIYRE